MRVVMILAIGDEFAVPMADLPVWRLAGQPVQLRLTQPFTFAELQTVTSLIGRKQ
jgi:hypothetical protein